MDSRIREIEQWIAEAKHDLGECGREAYINKLYLLDAEIRAIIKEDESLPAANSPRQRGNIVRRFSLPTTAVAAAVGLLLLTASTAYLTAQPAASWLVAFTQPAESSQPRPAAAATQPSLSPVGYIPSRIPGEEILPAGWQPPVTAQANSPSEPGASAAIILAAADQPAVSNSSAQPAAADPGSVATEPAAVEVPAAIAANQATEIALASFENPNPRTNAGAGKPNINSLTTSLGGEVEHTIATEVPTEQPEELLESSDDRGFYEQWYVDSGDNSIEELVDEYMDSEHKLNSAELAEKLREVLDKSKD
jgi:hypothetical protein